MKIVVIGSKGMLAQDLIPRLRNADIEVIGLDLPELDITRSEDISHRINIESPFCVINCAAYTAVDKAESEPDIAFAVNRDGSANLALACNKLNIPLLHISTDFVFNGNSKQPYSEDNIAEPLSIYGLSKWEGEQAIRASHSKHIIIRTAWLFSTHGKNFMKTMLRLAHEREEISVVNDQFGCPTWTGDLADALLTIVLKLKDKDNFNHWGTYHFCGSGHTTWYGFTCAIVDEAQKYDSLKVRSIRPINTGHYPTQAQRPVWSVLNTEKITSIFGIYPLPWKKALSEVIKMLYT